MFVGVPRLPGDVRSVNPAREINPYETIDTESGARYSRSVSRFLRTGMSGKTKSCTVFDVSGLTELKMHMRNGWQGSYFLNSDGECVAKTCASCRNLKGSSEFSKNKAIRFGIHTQCKLCVKEHRAVLSNRSDSAIADTQKSLRPDGIKLCYKCDESLPLGLFCTSRQKPDGLQDMCDPCLADWKIGKYPQYGKNHRAKMKARSDDQIRIDTESIYPAGEKPCTKCLVSKPLSDFYPKPERRDGLRRTCRECDLIRNDLRRKDPHIDYWIANGIPLVCYVCGDPWEHADHVLAESRGGVDDSYNRLPICQPCNSSKWKTPLDEWLLRARPDYASEVLHKVLVVYGMII